MAKVIKWVDNYGTSQIYHSGVELALCSDKNEQIGPFVYCKDFFQDAVVVFLHGGTCNVYGYKYDPKKHPPIPKKNLKVLIANAKDTKLSEKVKNIPDFLHQIESKLGVQKTVIEECANPPEKYSKSGIYLMTADPIWMHAPPLLSCWTLLARNGLNHKKGAKWTETVDSIIAGKTPAAQSHDRTYLKHGKPGIELILKKGIKALFGDNQKENYPKSKAGHTMHHYSGIVSYGSCIAKTHFPKWTYPQKGSTPPSICFA